MVMEIFLVQDVGWRWWWSVVLLVDGDVDEDQVGSEYLWVVEGFVEEQCGEYQGEDWDQVDEV